DDFRRCVQRYDGNRSIRRLSCWDQFLAMAFAQLTYRHSLRDIEACLGAQRSKLYHCGFRGSVRRSTLADANERRDWRIYADFAHSKFHDSYGLDLLIPEPCSFVVMDRAYIDFARLYALDQALAFFVLRAKKNLQFYRRLSYPVDRRSGVRSDQSIVLTGPLT